jgi:Spy/CpxP family protein refolding chaperone
VRGVLPARFAPPGANSPGRRKKSKCIQVFGVGCAGSTSSITRPESTRTPTSGPVRIGWGRRWAHFHPGGGHGGHHGFDEQGGGFGVRRPLRFLAHKLDLNDDQVSRFAAILDRLKTERAQADVDQRRRTAALAEAFESASFDASKVDAANDEQAKSAERLRASIKLALEQMHALLDAEQRKKFAYFLRAGILAI